jgi:hypothetical protein
VRKSLSLLIVLICAMSVLSLAGCGHSPDPIKRVKQYTGVKLPNDTVVLYDEILWGGKYNMDYINETLVFDASNLHNGFFDSYGFKDSRDYDIERKGEFVESVLNGINILPFSQERKPSAENDFRYTGGFISHFHDYSMFYFPEKLILVVFILRSTD